MIVTGTCQQCSEAFERQSNGKREQARFCSRACVARHIAARRKGTGKTSRLCACGSQKHVMSATCNACRTLSYTLRTLGELRQAYTTAAFHAKVRGLARNAYDGPRECAACGYSLHVDICHIRDVKDFPPDATMAEVNHPDNLLALDKRCHWEFDHGYLVIVDGRLVAGAGVEPA